MSGHAATRAGLTLDQLGTIVESAADGILVVDHDGVIRFVNPAGGGLFGREPDELLGFPFGHPVTTDQPSRIELVRRGGERCIAELRASPIDWDGDGARLVVIRDVSDPLAEEVSRLHLHVQGLSLRLTEIEQRLTAIDER